MTGDTAIQKKERVISQNVDDQAVIVDLESSHFFNLNKIGTIIWEQIDGQKSLTDIAGYICGKFEIPEEQALEDVRDFLADMQKKGLVIYDDVVVEN
jgi:Coenzyme PQQ synthesis protein D (PqqD)